MKQKGKIGLVARMLAAVSKSNTKNSPRLKGLIALVESSDIDADIKTKAIKGLKRIQKNNEANWAGDFDGFDPSPQAAFAWCFTAEGDAFWRSIWEAR